MKEILTIILLWNIYFLHGDAQDPMTCSPFKPPRHGSVSCPDGRNNGDRCRFSCDEGYVLAKGSPRNKRCVCRRGKQCAWGGKRQPICKLKVSAPSKPTGKCDIPSFVKASYGVVDVWPTGAVLKVTIKPTQTTTDGWSVVLLLAKPLSKSVQIDTGHVSLASTSSDRRILTFNSMPHNKDISSMQVYSFHLYLEKLPKMKTSDVFAALVGFYDKVVGDGSCLQNIGPIRPIPNLR